MGVGKEIRLSRMLSSEPSLFVPLDDSLINGPEDGLLDISRLVTAAAQGADGILAFQGLLSRYASQHPQLARVANLTASTTRSQHTNKQRVGSVESAARAACDGVAAHINVSSRYEPSMLRLVAEIRQECEVHDLPLLVIAYPRREDDKGDDNYDDLKRNDRQGYARLVRHCVRLAADLGADIIKTQFTGDVESFETVVSAAYDVPIWIAGGAKRPETESLEMARLAIAAGARGVCYGRQTHQAEDPRGYLERVRSAMTKAC
jgi:DhnA family fructose-bisphosphate aldolase class Ia